MSELTLRERIGLRVLQEPRDRSGTPTIDRADFDEACQLAAEMLAHVLITNTLMKKLAKATEEASVEEHREEWKTLIDWTESSVDRVWGVRP